jgi:hypothetical protein
MTKLTHAVLHLIAIPHHAHWWHAHLPPATDDHDPNAHAGEHLPPATVDHDPNARAGEPLPHGSGPGLYGVLVSNRN